MVTQSFFKGSDRWRINNTTWKIIRLNTAIVERIRLKSPETVVCKESLQFKVVISARTNAWNKLIWYRWLVIDVKMFVYFNHVANLPSDFECWNVDESVTFLVRKVSVGTYNPGCSSSESMVNPRYFSSVTCSRIHPSLDSRQLP